MTTSDEAALPKSVELLWRLDQPGGRGPKRGLTLDQILEAAIEVADAEGYAALSMNRVAQQLGFTAMSLYRYVDSKNTLVELLLDRVIGEPPHIPPGTPWRTGLEYWARSEFEVVGRHPWWLDIPLKAPPMGPNNMAWLEAGLATLADTAVPEPVRLQLVMNLSLYVIGRRWAASNVVGGADGEQDFTAALRRVLDPQRFPAVLSALAHSAFDQDDIDWEKADFEFGLARMLDGYESLVRSFES
ncbi:TetR/AcrR family transcriptional regulator [Nocardia bhagyanarayanae]|uniref:TetR family transcriptional regulator n=1 Tax=Nocardia bhagyanarayanae TaxID=1215925 RepID=A0A543EV77_9NOCA|nr:TetR/AcrR family transcriptional regulator [Nocardia bhagyanarayanae]TQM25471.1 TetR family transcriptional regulator [Nocardia bhagyanarayanae]